MAVKKCETCSYWQRKCWRVGRCANPRSNKCGYSMSNYESCPEHKEADSEV